MDMDEREASLIDFGEVVDRAVQELLADSELDHREVADELRRIAQGWEDAA